ncbi:hypothetical protein HanXRQr2_Chr16g0726081 [Helianthus annuus]|uniref:Uncharacterized protein n=1 Tax=Helianthus annuus TaxID=4232 RepID=A0A9K3GYF0_HELAN|nr:hypothetical protein HanXRQr2_Chr16g0726081 [Helianthus annuus]KAJ0819449.1 hypothetical protein HanPSC8_Chr16g0696221 [Helianthus annuus]
MRHCYKLIETKLTLISFNGQIYIKRPVYKKLNRTRHNYKLIIIFLAAKLILINQSSKILNRTRHNIN